MMGQHCVVSDSNSCKGVTLTLYSIVQLFITFFVHMSSLTIQVTIIESMFSGMLNSTTTNCINVIQYWSLIFSSNRSRYSYPFVTLSFGHIYDYDKHNQIN